jgi:hypothetical protein
MLARIRLAVGSIPDSGTTKASKTTCCHLGSIVEARRADTLIPWMGFMHGGMDRRVWELVALSALAGLGCGLAAVQGDLLFVALFGAVSVVTIVETIRRFR